jgi:hypothetical protein
MVRISHPTQEIPRHAPESNRFEAAPFAVNFDHRERAGGWRFEGLRAGSEGKYRQLIVPTVECHMHTADYTATLPDGTQIPVLIERKSGDDLLGSICGGHVNLRKEHERMQRLIKEAGFFCCLVCEASLSELLDTVESPMWSRSVGSELLLGCAASWPAKYGVPWYFTGSRAAAERLAYKTLHKAWERFAESLKKNRKSKTLFD